MRSWLQRSLKRLSAAWGVLTARRCIVVTYDPKQPPNVLGYLYLCAPCQEVPERLAVATLAVKRRAAQGDTPGAEPPLSA